MEIISDRKVSDIEKVLRKHIERAPSTMAAIIATVSFDGEIKIDGMAVSGGASSTALLLLAIQAHLQNQLTGKK